MVGNEYHVQRSFGWDGCITEKSAAVMQMFGVDAEQLRNNGVNHSMKVRLGPRQVCFITGASGSGKSVLLRELYGAIESEAKVNLDEIELPAKANVVDCVDGELMQSLRFLNKSGLNDVYTVLNQPNKLSEGQKYRFRFAMALASGAEYVFADEFCSNLDRITAMVIAHNVRRYADRYNKCFVLASSHDDLMDDLLADVVVVKKLAGPAEVVYRDGE